jgi:hypothetical protein
MTKDVTIHIPVEDFADELDSQGDFTTLKPCGVPYFDADHLLVVTFDGEEI